MSRLRQMSVPLFLLVSAASTPAPAQPPSCAMSWRAMGGTRAALAPLRHWLETCPLDANSQAARIRIRALERSQAAHPAPPMRPAPRPADPGRFFVCPGDRRCPRHN